MIVTKGKGRTVIVRHRDKDGTRRTTKIDNYRPYFFVEDVDANLITAVAKEKGFKGLYGENLTKIICADPQQIYDFKKKNADVRTWEANIPFVNRVLTDRVNDGHAPFQQYKNRTWYLDCEWSPTTKKMRVIVVYDSTTENEYVWFLNPSLKEVTSFSEYGGYTYDIPAMGFPSESEMLTHFLRHMDRQDPDIITGWYVVGADIKTIIERCKATGIQATMMSPMRRLHYTYKDWEQPIAGRNCIDLMVAFSKLWELKNGKLPSYKLDDVAWEVLGEKKIELPDGHDTFLTNLPLYIHYCRQDVRLLPKLDTKVNALEYYTSLQHIVQCDIRTTPYITKMFTNLALMDKEHTGRLPTKSQFDYRPYDGADVMEVKSGLHNNVGILDIKAMYHSNAALHNISWDTLDPEGKDCGNGTRFSQGKRGLLIRQMDKMTKLRDIFKKKMVVSDGKERAKWDTMQFAAKTLVASMYGVAGDSKFGLYHPDIAAAITHTSRKTLGKLKEIAEDRGCKVLYGHTDSVFCTIGSPSEGEALMASINAQMKPIEVQFEKWCPSIILMAKNRYAGSVTWTDGKSHEPKLYIKGIEMKQSRMPPVMKEVMGKTIEMILDNKTEQEVGGMIIPIIDSIVKKEIDINSLCLKGKLEKRLSEYKVLSGSSAGAAWANEFLGKGYTKGSFFKVILSEQGKYIAYDDPSDLEGVVNIGHNILCERFVINKVQPYYQLMNWSLQPLSNALNGVSRLVWV